MNRIERTVKMKVTNQEVEKAFERYYGSKPGGEIICGVEADDDMVIVWNTNGGFAAKAAEAFSQSVMILAKRHGEKYRPYIMGDQTLRSYKADSGFKVVEGESAAPHDIATERWEAAAPELLDVLEKVAFYLAAHSAIFDNQALTNNIRRIIKKARGEDGMEKT